jgi:hypothetical protein
MERANGQFEVTFDLRAYSGIRALRFDPLEGNPCICRIDREASGARFTAANASARVREGDLFLTSDPIYQVKGFRSGEILKIRGELQVLSMEEALARADRILKKSVAGRLGLER